MRTTDGQTLVYFAAHLPITIFALIAASAAWALGGTPEQFAAYIREETAKWARVVQASGAKLD